MKKFILPLAAFFLILFYALSFVDFSKQGEKKFSFSSSEISEIEISRGKSSLTIFNSSGVFKGVSDYIIFPVETNIIEKVLEKLSQKRTATEIYDSEKKEKSVFGIDENLSYCVKILNSDGSKNEFLFGNSDFSGLNRFVFFKEFNDSQLNNKILKTDFNIDELFHTETRFWIDPYLIPKSFTQSPFEIARIEVSCNSKTYNIFPGDKKNLDGTETEIISKLLDLRHGQVLNAKNKNESVISLKVELSGGDVFSVLIKPYSKTDYSVEYITDSKNDKYNYSVLISNWTFKTVWSLLT